MSLSLALALALFVAVTALLALSYRRARRRLRGELATFTRIHNEALDRLTGGEVAWRDAHDADGWRALCGERAGLSLRLAAVGTMKRSTFIEYTTELTIAPPAGQAFALPQDTPTTIDPGASPALGPLGLEAELADRLGALAVELSLAPEALVLVARPSAPAVRRYSYGIRLQLDPAVLARLLEAGAALGEHLLADQ